MQLKSACPVAIEQMHYSESMIHPTQRIHCREIALDCEVKVGGFNSEVHLS